MGSRNSSDETLKNYVRKIVLAPAQSQLDHFLPIPVGESTGIVGVIFLSLIRQKHEVKMFSWMSSDERRKKEPEVFANVAEGLKKLYRTKLLPLEEYYKFHEFHSPPLCDPDFDAKPMILLVGQYSTGKTTFIR